MFIPLEIDVYDLLQMCLFLGEKETTFGDAMQRM